MMTKIQTATASKLSHPRAAYVLLPLLVLSAFLLGGCPSNLSGDVADNSKPKVQFVNIPPEGQQFSRNPIVYWYGTDIDGIISFYRYHVVTVSELNSQTPEAYAATLDSTDWTYLFIDPTGTTGSQQTEVSIRLIADTLDPVLSYVPQYVFVQAYDNEGLGSDIVYRLFSRNDNPPTTLLFGSTSGSLEAPFVNAPTAGGVITGVRLNWGGSDPIDYPSDPPPFDFEWKLFGPYTDAEVTTLRAQYVVARFITREGKVFNINDTLLCCNADSSSCTKIAVKQTNLAAINSCFGAGYGVFDTTFLANSSAFTADTLPVTGLYRLAAHSDDGHGGSWVTQTSDTIYNVFASADSIGGGSPSVTTQRQFVFWIRCRDDALVPDLGPAYKFIHVINPRYERSAIVLDFTFRGGGASLISAGSIKLPAAMRYFKQAMAAWDPSVEFDTMLNATTGVGKDYVNIQKTYLNSRLPISWLLSHKVMILYNDAAAAAALDTKSNFYLPIFTAIDGGVNAWVTARCALSKGSTAGPDEAALLIVNPVNAQYISYFGVLGVTYSGWFFYAFPPPGQARIEDFVGTYTLLQNDPGWPSLSIDNARIHDTAYVNWGGVRDAGINALPEVGWAQRIAPGTDAIYLYKSLYGNQHPLGGPYTMEGAPCGHRFNTGLYRTVNFTFTPVVMDSTTMQTVFNSVMDWLTEEGNLSATAKLRYDDAPMPMSKAAARRNYNLRVTEEDEAYFLEHPELRVIK